MKTLNLESLTSYRELKNDTFAIYFGGFKSKDHDDSNTSDNSNSYDTSDSNDVSDNTDFSFELDQW